jgi:hypothetical protein
LARGGLLLSMAEFLPLLIFDLSEARRLRFRIGEGHQQVDALPVG